MRRRLLLAIGISWPTVTAWGQSPMLMRLGTLSLDFPPAWQFQGAGQRAEGQGPDGEAVILHYRVLRPGAPEEVVRHHWGAIRGFANDKMPELAATSGEVLRPVTEAPLPGGRALFSSISKTGVTGEGYFVQYLIGSSRLMAYITVEGRGNAVEAAGRFERILATQRWDE